MIPAGRPERPAKKARTTLFMVGAVVFLSMIAPAARGFVVPSPAARLSLRPAVSSCRGGGGGGSSSNSRAASSAQEKRPQSGIRAARWLSSVTPLGQGHEARTPMLASPLPEIPSDPPSKPPVEPKLVYGESTQRSFVKALVWRLTAGVVTLISGLVYSGSLATALSIVGSDFVSKSGFMFAGERLWNKVKWGQGKSGDSAKRSLAKAVLWRVFAASNTLICGIFLAKDLSIASKIAGTDTIFKTGLFFVNERVWASISWGKQYEPEYFI